MNVDIFYLQFLTVNLKYIYDQCITLLLSKYPSKPPILDLARDFTDKNNNTCRCFINSTIGTFAHVGFAIVEANNSSVFSHLGRYVAGNFQLIFLKLMYCHKHITL